MIKQARIGLNSRNEANPFDESGFLPIITAPMYSVVDENNYQIFLDNKVRVCLPRGIGFEGELKHMNSETVFVSCSLQDFIDMYVDGGVLTKDLQYKECICIDTANGNMSALHDAIRKAKEIHGDTVIIMAGNVASVEAFVELATTGIDYIRVGIGGGGGCNTTSNTGIGQENLADLIFQCYLYRKQLPLTKEVKIVADGISSYIKFCEKEYGFNDNGYAAINKLLCSGANLVMVGSLFAQCVESAGEKNLAWHPVNGITIEDFNKYKNTKNPIMVKYSGMSTQQEQKKYKELELIIEKDENLDVHHTVNKQNIKPSEGSVKWIPVRWTLQEWLYGSDNQDEYPYLMGWINSIKSAMSYLGTKNL